MPVHIRPGMSRASTPCILVCVLDAGSGLCQGCGRTADEIGRWGSMSERERLSVMGGLEARMREAFRSPPASGDRASAAEPAS